MNKRMKAELYKRGIGENNHTHNPKKTHIKTVFTEAGFKERLVDLDRL